MPTILITGTNRGIGLEFAKAYAAKGWKVIAAVRNVSSQPKIEGDVRVVKIVADSLTDAGDVAKQLQSEGIKLDVVIANAGINPSYDTFEKLDPTLLTQTLATNVRGPLVLFQAVKPLLSDGGKFVAISSGAGIIQKDMQSGQGVYELSKCALNYLVRKLHFENPEILVAAFSPGWVKTDMGNSGAQFRGMEEAPEDIKETVPGMIKQIEEGDREKLGGVMTNWNGDKMPF